MSYDYYSNIVINSITFVITFDKCFSQFMNNFFSNCLWCAVSVNAVNTINMI